MRLARRSRKKGGKESIVHRTQKFLAGLAVSALSVGGLMGLENTFQGAAAQSMSYAPNARSASNPQGRILSSGVGVRSVANHATLLVSQPCDSEAEYSCYNELNPSPSGTA
jgi:hypothetical protein